MTCSGSSSEVEFAILKPRSSDFQFRILIITPHKKGITRVNKYRSKATIQKGMSQANP